jgi:hypothetical protein
MSKKQIGAALGALILAVAAPLLTLALLHGVGGTAEAQAPPASYTKDSVPDFGQHSTGWCWVGAAANSFWWYAYHGYPSLLGGGSAPYPWEATDPLSRQVGSICQGGGAGTSLYDANDLPQGYLGPLPIPGYRQVMSKIAQTTFMDANQDGQRQPATENNYCYSQGVEEWDYLVGLGTYVNSYGSGLKVHDIIDPARCIPDPWGKYGMKPDDRLNPPAFNALNPCGLDGVPNAEFAFDQAPGPPTFLDYQTELSGGQDVLLWMESTYPETAHVVTGVGYNTSPAPGTITISDPWTHSACPDHDDCWPLKARLDGQMPDHNNDPTHDTVPAPYNVCNVTSPGAPFTINCGGTIWTVVDLIFVSPAGADIKVLTFYSEPEPPFEFVVSENNVINLIEDKHNNGPEDALVDVSWTVDPIPDLDGDGSPDINVRWEALMGDRCTSGGLPVACGEGDGLGTGGSGDGYPSLTGDNCQDGIDNDQDGLYDFDDPDCQWELDDIHFQIWLPVSAATQINRGLKMHCAVAGDYTVTLNNDELPVDVEDPDPSNNSRTLDLPITCTAAADVKILSQEILAANCIDLPPTDIDVSVDKDICVQKVLHNNGPYTPVSVNIVKTATAPQGCTILPANPTDQVVLDDVDLIHDELFTIHCDEPSTHGPFTIDNAISIKDPGVTDPTPTNNVASSTLTVDALVYADIKITSQSFLNPPSQMTVGVPEVVTLRKQLHNNGLYGPVTVNIVKTAYTDSPDATIAPPTASAQADLAAGSTVTHDEVFTIGCSAPGTYTYTVDNDVTPKDPHIVDVGGASASTDLIVECVAGAQEIKWQQLPDESPLGLDVADYQPFVLADDFQCTASGLITEIDFWGSWDHNVLPMGGPSAVLFTLSLHSDVPAGGQPPWSHPADVLWMHTFGPGECVPELSGSGDEGWLEPPDSYEPHADNQIWLYSCPIPSSLWFQQAEGTIYWLDVQAIPMGGPGAAFFGWKTSLDHWNDDGVWSMGMEPIDPASWYELRYPPGHPMAGMSIDLAFQMWGQDCPAGVDTDLDGFNDDIECYLPTDRLDDCPDVIGVDDAWPLDNDMTRLITGTGDVFAYVGKIGSKPGDPNWSRRLDLDMSGLITGTGDVFMYVGKIGSTCTP